jgi:hypothetical protein
MLLRAHLPFFRRLLPFFSRELLQSRSFSGTFLFLIAFPPRFVNNVANSSPDDVFLLAIPFFASIGQLIELLSPAGLLLDFSGVEFNPVIFHQFLAQNLIHHHQGESLFLTIKVRLCH